MKKIALTFGLISGAVLSVMMLVTMKFQDQIGFDRGEVVGYTTMVVSFLLIYFGMRSYRDNIAGGSMSFGRALAVGMSIAAVASLCYVATWEVVYFKLAPDFAAKYQAYEFDKARANGATEAELTKKKAEMESQLKMYNNPAINAAITFLEPMPVALIVSLVSAGVLSRRKRSGLVQASAV